MSDHNEKDANPEFSDEEWVFLGPSPAEAGVYRWRDGNGELLAYDKFKARVFGGIYTVKVLRTPPDGVRVRLTNTFTGRRAEDCAIIEVQALRVEDSWRIKRLEANAKRTANIDEAIAPLLELAASLPIMSDRGALLHYVTGKVYAATKKKKGQ